MPRIEHYMGFKVYLQGLYLSVYAYGHKNVRYAPNPDISNTSLLSQTKLVNGEPTSKDLTRLVTATHRNLGTCSRSIDPYRGVIPWGLPIALVEFVLLCRSIIIGVWLAGSHQLDHEQESQRQLSCLIRPALPHSPYLVEDGVWKTQLLAAERRFKETLTSSIPGSSSLPRYYCTRGSYFVITYEQSILRSYQFDRSAASGRSSFRA